MIQTSRRAFLLGLAAGLAPAVIRTPGLLMPVKALVPTSPGFEMLPLSAPSEAMLLLFEHWSKMESDLAAYGQVWIKTVRTKDRILTREIVPAAQVPFRTYAPIVEG